jgi:hypothetical protein
VNDLPQNRDAFVVEHVVNVTEIEPGRFRAVLTASPTTWTLSNFRMLDQRMRLEIGRRHHGGDSYGFDVRYLMTEDMRVEMISRCNPDEVVPPGSKALVLGPDHSKRGQEMIAWLRLRNQEDPLGRYLLRIIEAHSGGASGICGTCSTAAPCNTVQQLVMHYITMLGAQIEHR